MKMGRVDNTRKNATTSNWPEPMPTSLNRVIYACTLSTDSYHSPMIFINNIVQGNLTVY